MTYSRAGRALELLYTVTPRIYCRVAPGMFTDGSFSDESIGAHRGNLTEPAPGAAIGGWRGDRRPVLRRALVGATRGLARSLRR